MKKLKLDLESLDVHSFATETVPEARGTVRARGITILEQYTRPQEETATSFTYPESIGTGPCTTAPSSDFPCGDNVPPL